MLRSPDTSVDAHVAQMAVYRRMTGGQRMALALELSETVRTIARAGIRARHPEYSEQDVRDAFHRMTLGDALFRAAWPGRRLLDP